VILDLGSLVGFRGCLSGAIPMGKMRFSAASENWRLYSSGGRNAGTVTDYTSSLGSFAILVSRSSD